MFYAISKSSVLLLSISCFILTALVSMGVSFGIWDAIRYHDMHTVIFYRYSASVFLRMMRSVDVQ